MSKNLINTFKKSVVALTTASTILTGTVMTNPVNAATATATFAVTAAVLQTCVVTATALAFGTYDPAATSPNDASTSVLVTCTTGTTYNVGLSNGGGSGASTATRKLTSGSNTLNYSLYQDSGRNTVWGSSVGSDTVSGVATGLPVSHTIYGRISALQVVPQGAYTDTITVTITY